MSDALWNYDKPVADLGIDVPVFIEQDITGYTVAAIYQGGCDSGAYMPAVTYDTARETMDKHGDEVLEYLEGYGYMPESYEIQSWSGLAVLFLSRAVEAWVSMNMEDIEDAIDEDAEEE